MRSRRNEGSRKTDAKVSLGGYLRPQVTNNQLTFFIFGKVYRNITLEYENKSINNTPQGQCHLKRRNPGLPLRKRSYARPHHSEDQPCLP